MISVVIPVLNGEKSIPGVVSNLINMGRKENLVLEIILVDDASEDDSAEIIRQMAEELEPVLALGNSERCGQQETLLKGLDAATGDILVTMDDDAQHDPDEIPRLLHKLEEGYDLVYGIFYTTQTGRLRTAGSKARDALFHHLYPILGENQVGSFRAFTRDLHKVATQQPVRFSYISCLHLRQRPKVANIRMEERSSKRERSNYDLLALMRLLIKIYWYYGPGAHSNHRRDDI